MKSTISFVVLIIICLVLGGVVVQQRNQAMKKQEADQETILSISNELASTQAKLTEQQSVNNQLEVDLQKEQEEKKKFYDQLVNVSETLETVKDRAQQAAEQAEKERAEKAEKISELENEIDDKTIQMSALNVSITNLETQISETEKQLAASETDREFLLKELKRLQDEKNELERQFNNLAVVRDQVKKLKDELSIAKRLEWVRRGLFGVREMKGAEILKQGYQRETDAQPQFDLNIELREDEAPRGAPSEAGEGEGGNSPDNPAPGNEESSPNEGP